MKFDGFIGASYQLPAVQADSERCVNLYPEAVASEGGDKAQAFILVRTPGRKLLQTVGSGRGRGAFAIDGRAFVVVGSGFYELLSPQTSVLRGTIAATATPVSIKSNTVQIVLIADGLGWLFTLSNNTFAPISAAGFPTSALGLASIDTYFLTANQNSTKISPSALLDGAAWAAADAFATQQPDALAGLEESHGYLWAFGSQNTTPFQDTGALTNTFQRVPGAVINIGLASTWAIASADNTLFWLGRSAHGTAMVYRADGLLPSRVSNHALEAALQRYPTVADATAYAYQEAGHTFVRFDFPAGNATWVYDVATRLWHERARWNGLTYSADRARFYCQCFGMHLVLDHASGAVYQQSLLYADDAGEPLRWLRAAPHIESEQRFLFYSSLELAMQKGGGVPYTSSPTPVANMLMNAQGLVVNAYNNLAGRGDYFDQASGTSEGQFLYALGMFDAYAATGNPGALANAQLAISNLFATLYRGGAIPAQVDATHIFAPHWLFCVKNSFATAQIWYSDSFTFSGGAGVVPETRGPVRYIFQVTSVGATLLWDNPYAPLTSGTAYVIANTSYTAGVGTTVTLTTPFSGALRVIYSTQTGPTIVPGTPYEAWPDWRELNAGEIDSACDTYSWAYRMYLRAAELVGGSWADAARATLEQAAIVFDVNDARDWLKLAYTLNPFSDGSRFAFNSRATPASITCDSTGQVLLQIAAGAGETQYGNANINDFYSPGDSTTVTIGATAAVTVSLYIDPTQTYVPANRYSATLPLSGNGLQALTLTAADFRNPAGDAIPAGTTVYTFGISDSEAAAHTVTLGRVRQLPHRNIQYYPGALPFTANFLGQPATLIDWRGPAYVGYQSPWMWKRIGNEAGAANSVQMMADAALAWHAQTGQPDYGPFAPVFYFDRSDAVQYGPPNTFGWNGPDPNTKWAGYQYRPLAELAECWSICSGSEPYFALARDVTDQFLDYIDAHWSDATAGPPTDYPPAGPGEVNYPEPHFVALILRAVLFMDETRRPAQTGPLRPTYASLLAKALTFWTYWYRADGPMAGTFSSDADNRSWFGFWHGEILRTLAKLYTWALVNRDDATVSSVTTWMIGMIGFAQQSVAPAAGGTVKLRWSNDAGSTWSNPHTASSGAAGQYGQRVIWRRLGRGRNRVYEVSGSDPVPQLALLAAEIDVHKGTS